MDLETDEPDERPEVDAASGGCSCAISACTCVTFGVDPSQC